MATFTPAVNLVCLEFRQLVLLLILINCISDGTCQNISLSCPTLQEGSVTKFNCSVPTSMCTHSSVIFQFESKDGKLSPPCQTSSSSPCDQQSSGGMACGCVFSNSSFKYYQLNILGDKATYNEGKLTCNANCVPVPNPAVCQPLGFALPSTFPSTTTAKSGNKGNNMHVFRTWIVAFMSGIIALISTH